jgi:hypothetical protein
MFVGVLATMRLAILVYRNDARRNMTLRPLSRRALFAPERRIIAPVQGVPRCAGTNGAARRE